MDPRLVRLYVATFLFTLTMGVALPLVPQVMDQGFGASVALIGVAGAVYGVMQIVMRLPMGDVADRYGRKRSLLASFALAAASGLVYALAPNAWWILPAQGLLGFASGVFWVAANSYMFDCVSEEEVPRAASNYALAIGFAQLVAPPLGGALADAFGYAVALSTVAFASVAGFLVLWGAADVPRVGAPSPGGVYRRAWRILQHPDIWVSAVGTLLFSLVFSTLTTFTPIYLRAIGFTAFGVGLLFALRHGASLVVRWGLPRVIAARGPRLVLYWGLGLAAASTAAIPFLTSDFALGVVSAIAGFGTGVAIPANLTLVSRGAPPNEKGLANGIYGTALGLGSAVAPFVLGFVAARLGLDWAFWGASLVSLGGLAVLAAVAGAGAPQRMSPRAIDSKP